MKGNTSVYPKNRTLEDPGFVFLVSGLINALLGPEHVILTNRGNALLHDGGKAASL